MASSADRFRVLDAAFRAGDLDALRRELGSLEGFPNVIAHPAIGPCPLHFAAAQGDLDMVATLLAHGADAEAITRIDDHETALEVAAAAGHAKVVEVLRPRTPRLDWELAARTGDVVTLRRMLRSGHDVDSIDGHGLTALMRAAHEGHSDAVTLLIAHGPALDHASKFGLNALMLAVIGGHPRIARALVKAGADTAARAKGAPGFHDKTAADLAEERGDKRLATFIRVRSAATS